MWVCGCYVTKAKLTFRTGHKCPVANKRQRSTVSLTSDVDVSGWLLRHGRSTTEKINPVPLARSFLSDTHNK